jgi:CHAD domain-containing protein
MPRCGSVCAATPAEGGPLGAVRSGVDVRTSGAEATVFQLQGDRIADEVRRVVDELIDNAVADLRGETEGTRDAAVHETRKRCKRLRALLRLVRDPLGASVYQHENTAIRDAARLLAPVRDAQVLVNTLDAAVEDADGQLDAAALAPTRRALKAAHGRLRQQVIYRGTAVEQAIRALTAAQERSRDWPLGDLTFDDLRPGLQRVYRQGRRAMTQAYDDPTPERFHDWRKRVKYLWHHIELLEPAWPGLLEALADETHDLSDLLGDEHDRTVLGECVHERADLVADPEVARLLTAALDEQRQRLRAAARPLGARLYAEPPKRFAARIASYRRSGPLDA